MTRPLDRGAPDSADRAAPRPAPPAHREPAPRPRWDSARLFGAADEIDIVHRGTVYRMRITSLGKLILTK